MIGEELELIGDHISVENIAKDTSKYDIVVSLSSKLKRYYLK